VDDNKDAADVLGLLLQTLGYTTAVAYNGRAALDQLDFFQPRVILLDMNMPILNGYDTASAIRARPDSWKFYIIALSAYSDPTSIARMTEVGCNARLTKPASTESLLALFP
jgi:two-component system CheB/CheR fusion protein